jgi:hypothetical protein
VEAVHTQLLKLGFTIAQATVARYMARPDGCRPSGQRSGTFVYNHMPQIAAMDLFVVPTLGFNLLYVLGTHGGSFRSLSRQSFCHGEP